jgi:hypothetical protein
MSIDEKIIDVAKSYIGQTEIKGNKGFIDPDFEDLMRSVGFQTNHAWCSYFAELVWRQAYAHDPAALAIIKKLFSGSSYRTLRNFEKAGYKAEKTARAGSIVIWRKKRNWEYSRFGHVGICIEVGDDYFKTVEGNTNAAGSREGETVAMKTRKYSFQKENGLELAGFIHPIVLIPFKDKTEGDAFRAWVNDVHPATAEKIDLDRSGSFKNSYITEAFKIHGEEYMQRI